MEAEVAGRERLDIFDLMQRDPVTSYHNHRVDEFVPKWCGSKGFLATFLTTHKDCQSDSISRNDLQSK